MLTSIKNFLKWLFVDRWELTIYFPDDVKVLPDGTRLESTTPKVYTLSKVIKVSDKHFIFNDVNGVRHEIKVVQPVSYILQKTF